MGPHIGVLYGKYELLDRLRAYKVRRAPGEPPGKYETGTQNHEGIAGTLAAVNYLAGIGQQHGEAYRDRFPGFSGRRLDRKTGMTVLREYDHVLSAAILDELETLPGVRIHGITDRGRLEERVPTVSFTWEGREPREIAAALGAAVLAVLLIAGSCSRSPAAAGRYSLSFQDAGAACASHARGVCGRILVATRTTS